MSKTSTPLFESIWDLRRCLIEHNQTAFDVPLTKLMLDCCLASSINGETAKTKKHSAAIAEYISFVESKLSDSCYIKTYLEEASRHERFGIEESVVSEVKKSCNSDDELSGVQGAVIIKEDNAIKLFFDDHSTKDFLISAKNINHDFLFNSTFGYLVCYSIFKRSFELCLVDVDYTIYLNRIKRVVFQPVKAAGTSGTTTGTIKFIIGFISQTGDNWWRTLASVNAIETLLHPLALLDRLSRENGVSFIHGDLRLDNLVASPKGHPEIIDFGICSMEIEFCDKTGFEYRGYDPEEISVKHSICVDIFSLMASCMCRFIVNNKEFDCAVLDERLYNIPKKFRVFHTIAYENLCPFYKKNPLNFGSIVKNVRNFEPFNVIKMKNLVK